MDQAFEQRVEGADLRGHFLVRGVDCGRVGAQLEERRAAGKEARVASQEDLVIDVAQFDKQLVPQTRVQDVLPWSEFEWHAREGPSRQVEDLVLEAPQVYGTIPERRGDDFAL